MTFRHELYKKNELNHQLRLAAPTAAERQEQKQPKQKSDTRLVLAGAGWRKKNFLFPPPARASSLGAALRLMQRMGSRSKRETQENVNLFR